MKLVLVAIISSCASAFFAPAPLSGRAFVVSPSSMVAAPIVENELLNPVSSAADPKLFVKDLLDGLLKDPSASHSIKTLLHKCTPEWRHQIYDAIGAPIETDEDRVSENLAHAMTNPHNQFALLLGKANEGEYELEFPGDTVDYEYQEGKRWLETRLYSKKDGELMVVIGWEFQLDENGNWLVERFDWQDFRDAFFPGVGHAQWPSFV